MKYWRVDKFKKYYNKPKINQYELEVRMDVLAWKDSGKSLGYKHKGLKEFEYFLVYLEDGREI